MKTVEFGSLFRFIRNGMNVKQDKSSKGLPIARIETISAAIVDGTRVGYADLEEADCSRWLLETGDILFSHINSVEHIGKCAVYRGTPEKLVHGMNLLCLRSDTSKLLPEFAKYLIRGPVFRARLSNFINKAVNQASVSIGNLKTIPVALPPLEEQRRIVEVLERAEALRANRRAALARLDNLTQSIFLDMFGDPATNPKGWSKERVGDVSQQIRGVTYAKEDVSLEKKPGYLPILRAGNISDDGILLDDLVFVPEDRISSVQKLRLNDILIAASSGSLNMVGKAARVDLALEAGFGAFCKVLRPQERIDPIYFAAFFATRYYRRRITELAAGLNINNLRSEHLDGFLIPTPPSALQEEFSCRMAVVERVRTMHRVSLVTLDALFATLQHRAFRGEL